MRGFCGAFSRIGPSALVLPFHHLSPDSSQGAPFRSDTLLKTFLCFSNTLPTCQHQNQSVYSGFSVRQELPPPPSTFSPCFLHSGCGSDIQGRPLPQSPRPACSLCLEPFSPGNHVGCPPHLQVWVPSCLLFGETVMPGQHVENHHECIPCIPDCVVRMWLTVFAVSVVPMGTIGVTDLRRSWNGYSCSLPS